MLRLMLILCCAALLQAQQPQEFELSWSVAPRVERLDVGTGILYLVGGVDVRINDLRVRCDSLVAWLARPTAEGAAGRHFVKEIYAEGTVFLFQGEESTRAGRLWLDLPRQRGIVIDAVRVSPLPLRNPPEPAALTLRAEELRLLSPDRILALGVSATTCTFGHPHWHLSSEQLELIRDPADPEVDPAIRNLHIEAAGNRLALSPLGSVPLPDLNLDSESDGMLGSIETARLGNSDQFGLNLGVTIGQSLSASGREVARLHFPIDYFTRRGPAVGLNAEYGDHDSPYRGRLSARWLHDRGSDYNFGTPPSEERGHIALYHRHELPGGVRADVEINASSDRGYYPTWFETEWKTWKPPENLLYLSRPFENAWLTGLFTHRFNGFMDTTLFEPQLGWELVAEPLAEVGDRPLLLNVSAEAAIVRRLSDNATNLSSPTLTRTDLDAVVELSQPLGPFTVTPFAGLRWSTFSRDLAGNRVDRLGLLTGARFQIEAWKDYPGVAESLGLDGLRHRIQPAITVRSVSGMDVDPASLIPIDSVEQASDVAEIEFEVRNLLTTLKAPDRTPVNLLDADLSVSWYPDAELSPHGSSAGPLRFDVLVRPADSVELAIDGEWDLGDGQGDLLNSAIGWKPSDRLRLAGGLRHFSGTPALGPDSAFDMFFVQTDWRIEEKWLLAFQSSYETRQSSGLRYAAALSRIGHDFVLRGTLYADPLEGEFGFALSFQPRLMFRGTRGFREIGGEPRFDLFDAQ